ncbi:MAG: tRNA uridine-5-carboxymethylaminomethyl(34) synthesis GTPase MnmE [Candidatus Omnitrophica bacterium]|nr:tRNA uridine-5-carboxymethylaminomethyl(34) synthesis GTPase MnmE [Candidatus Omnitrophota bacterium]
MAKGTGEDTVCAISTPVGEGGIGVIRLSGGRALEIADHFFQTRSGRRLREFPSHTVHFGLVKDGRGKVLDEVIGVFYRGPKSYTGEDVVEISAHGGMKVLQEILQALIRAGARQAEPGEFTKRAFLNGRIDLAQAEAVMDLIRAKTELSREQACRQLQGEFSRQVRKLREDLLKIAAHVEAYVDFPEDDLEVYSQPEFLEKLNGASAKISAMLDSYERGAVLKDGVLCVIAGRPNVGKSSLLNALLDRDRAIVTDLPGTTRDALEEQLDIGGLLVRIVDTAGIRQGTEAVEALGVERTRRYLAEAQLVLFMLEAPAGVTAEDLQIFEEIRKKKYILVVNKIDLPGGEDRADLGVFSPEARPVYLSVRTKEGLKDLEKRILETAAAERFQSEGVAVTRVRHKQALEKCREALRKAREGFEKRLSLEFIAFDLREAMDRLGEIVGEIYTEDLLDVVFREFCIGK